MDCQTTHNPSCGTSVRTSPQSSAHTQRCNCNADMFYGPSAPQLQGRKSDPKVLASSEISYAACTLNAMGSKKGSRPSAPCPAECQTLLAKRLRAWSPARRAQPRDPAFDRQANKCKASKKSTERRNIGCQVAPASRHTAVGKDKLTIFGEGGFIPRASCWPLTCDGPHAQMDVV